MLCIWILKAFGNVEKLIERFLRELNFNIQKERDGYLRYLIWNALESIVFMTIA